MKATQNIHTRRNRELRALTLLCSIEKVMLSIAQKSLIIRNSLLSLRLPISFFLEHNYDDYMVSLVLVEHFISMNTIAHVYGDLASGKN